MQSVSHAGILLDILKSVAEEQEIALRVYSQQTTLANYLFAAETHSRVVRQQRGGKRSTELSYPEKSS